MQSTFNFAKKLIEKASKVIQKNYKKASKISYKKGLFNLVTDLDKKVEKLIVKEIKKQFPNHSIVGEESGLHKNDPTYQWFIDPIDGTTNFAHRYPCFCISIALVKNGVIEFGLVKNPETNDLYSAIKNKGAKLNGKKIKVSNAKRLKDSLLATGFSYRRSRSIKKNNLNNFCKLTLITHGVRRDGSAAMDLCYVASGKLDGFWELNLSPWDVAAGVLILKEAGGKITRFKGKEYNIYAKEIVATNGKLHKALLNKLV